MKKLLSQYGGLKKEIYILFVGKLVTAMGSFVWPMLTFFLTTKLGISDGTATFLVATAGLLMLPAALMGGKLADRFSRKNIIIIFDLLTVTFYVLAAVLPIRNFTVVLLFLAGLFQTIEGPAYDALVADFSTATHREKAFSLNYLGFNLGFIVGASLSGLLFEFHTQLAFLLNGLAILTSTVLIILFVNMKNAVGETEDLAESYTEYEMPVEENRSIISVLKDRRVIGWMLLVGCVACLPSNLVGVLLPLQLKETMGQGGATIYGYLNSLNGFTVIVLTPILTMVLRRFTEIPKIVLSHLLFLGGMVLFAGGNLLIPLFGAMLVYSVGEVVSVLGSNPYYSRRIPASHRGRIGGISTVIYSLASSAAQYAISLILVLTDNNYPVVWWVFIGVNVLAAGLYAVTYGFDRKTFPKLYEDMTL